MELSIYPYWISCSGNLSSSLSEPLLCTIDICKCSWQWQCERLQGAEVRIREMHSSGEGDACLSLIIILIPLILEVQEELANTDKATLLGQSLKSLS